MEKNRTLSTVALYASTSVFLCSGSMAFAADAGAARHDAGIPARGTLPDQTLSSENIFGNIHRASDLLGMEVRNQQNEKLGIVKDLMVDLHGGRVPFAVLSTGGLMGLGDRLMAVPSSAFQRGGDDRLLALNIEKERFTGAPTLESNQWPDTANEAWATRIYQYYGERPYWETRGAQTTLQSDPSSSSYSAAAGTVIPIHPGFSPDRSPRRGLGAQDLAQREMRLISGETVYSKNAYFQKVQGPTETRNAAIDEPAGAEKSTASTLNARTIAYGPLTRASELMGMEVNNPQNERVGEIKDIVLNLHAGRVAYAVLGAGGFLGIGDKLFSVPPALFTRRGEAKALAVNLNRDQLKGAPAFDRANWRTQLTPNYGAQVYRYYGQEPYWQEGSVSTQQGRGSELRDPAGAESRRRLDESATNGWQKGYYYQDKSRSDSEFRNSKETGSKETPPDIHSDTYRRSKPASTGQTPPASELDNQLEVKAGASNR